MRHAGNRRWEQPSARGAKKLSAVESRFSAPLIPTIHVAERTCTLEFGYWGGIIRRRDGATVRKFTLSRERGFLAAESRPPSPMPAPVAAFHPQSPAPPFQSPVRYLHL